MLDRISLQCEVWCAYLGTSYQENSSHKIMFTPKVIKGLWKKMMIDFVAMENMTYFDVNLKINLNIIKNIFKQNIM